MGNNKNDKFDIDARGNIIIQDVSGGEITVNYNDIEAFGKLVSSANETLLIEIQTLLNRQNINPAFVDIFEKFYGLPPELKLKKKEIKYRIDKLTSTLFLLGKKSRALEMIDDKDNCEDCFDKSEWDNLLEAIEDGDCILFIGQEISVDENDVSLNEKFFKGLEKDFDVKYHINEGFFSPSDNDLIKYKVKRYYKETFHKENKTGRKILTELAHIPFSLIISLTPDNTMHRIFSDFDQKHQYFYYDGEKRDVEKPTIENPLIYNIIGEAENYDYIFTHENYYDYIRNLELPTQIKKKLQTATHFLFFGFDFNKWYNRLLLFFLNLSKRKKKLFGHAIEISSIDEEFKSIVEKQFNITFVSNNYSQFLRRLLLEASKENLTKDLNNDFVERNKKEVDQLSKIIALTNECEQILKVEKEIEQIENKVLTFEELTCPQ